MSIKNAAGLRKLLNGARYALVPVASSLLIGCGAVESTVGFPSGEPVEVAITVTAVDAPGQATGASLQLEVGQEAELAATALNALGQPVGSALVTWGSTDESVATVSDGEVVAVGPGDAEIVAAANEVYSTLAVAVTAVPAPPTTP